MTKTVLISGGSRGIGRATALIMAGQGWNIAFTYRGDHDAAQQAVEEIRAKGAEAIAIQGDTVQEDHVVRAFDETISTFGGLDAVVVNAGVVAPSMPLAEMSIERLKTIFDTNVLGAVLFAREAARRLPDQKTGKDAAIVLVSSAAARLGSPFEYVDYAASKGAIDTLTLGLSKELAGQGIRVNAIRPGLIETDLHASGGQPDRAERLSKAIPIARPGTAHEVGSAIAWLCSEEASYCTGGILDVTGGR
ncbi:MULTISPECIES: SDR family oxidoreductase [Cohaesibacter]|uniref:SDR family oxidoreductase n=1 Tax=Cohaesibacter TaxID=655352 RepID=UPI000DE98ADE|nr:MULTISPECIES: SDR family oxidoreductase [Cohaesibacter]TLP43929.1 SDR family oxidoreductase [Cohaesibacter sp. CAU 1516]